MSGDFTARNKFPRRCNWNHPICLPMAPGLIRAYRVGPADGGIERAWKPNRFRDERDQPRLFEAGGGSLRESCRRALGESNIRTAEVELEHCLRPW